MFNLPSTPCPMLYAFSNPLAILDTADLILNVNCEQRVKKGYL
jgi:hypothetical protein